jgi:antitoxin component YwqK of YwqJK toxin-antitoxin module
MIYTILSSSPATERDLVIYDLEKFIEICDFNLDNLKDWFESYRFDEEVLQGEEYFEESILREIQLPDGSKTKCKIPVTINSCSTHDFDKEVEVFKSKLKNRQILIKGEMHWSSGNWNSFSIDLNEDEKFEVNKIKGEGYLGMVIGYSYADQEFQNNEDWMLKEGYINLNVYININNQVVELDLNAIESYLEKSSIEVSLENTERIFQLLESYHKEKNIRDENKSHDGIHKMYFDEKFGADRFPPGLLYQEGFLKNGNWNGLSKVYHPNGELNMEGYYRDGLKVARWKIYSKTTPYLESKGLKGSLWIEMEYKEDYSQDDFEEIKAQNKNIDGIKDGSYKRYHSNGNIEEEGIYKNDQKVGIWKKYSYDGELNYEENF